MTNGADAARQSPWERWGWLMAVVWMVFLAYPVYYLLSSRADAGWVVVGWVALVTFAVLYVVGFVLGFRGDWHHPRPAVIVMFFGMLGCSAAMIPSLGTGALGFAPFLMAYASYGLGRIWHWCVNGLALATSIVVLVVYGPADGNLPFLGIILMMFIVNTITTWLIGRSAEAEALKVQSAVSEERVTVARDVHDLLGHSLTVVKMKAELASRLIDADPARARAELDEIVQLTGEAIAGVRSTVTGLRATGLGEQLDASRTALESAGVAVRTRGRAEALSPAQSLLAAWILREATTNVIRHSGASRVDIEIAPGTLVVRDDGAGIGEAARGNGIRGMAERATAAGAVLRAEDAAEGGTRVSVIW